MSTDLSIFTLYTKHDKPKNAVRLNLELSEKFLRACRQIYTERDTHLIKFCATFDCVMYLSHLVDGQDEYVYANKEEKTNHPDWIIAVFKYINTQGIYISEFGYETIKKEFKGKDLLHDCFLDELCFLIGFYAWLVPLELEINYAKKIQDESHFITCYEGIVNDRIMPALIKSDLQYKNLPSKQHYDYLKKNRVVEGMRNELMTTDSENTNLILVRRRIFEELYGYFKTEINPNTRMSRMGIVQKIAVIKNIPYDQAMFEILNDKSKSEQKRLYFFSEQEMWFYISKVFKLLGLLPKGVEKYSGAAYRRVVVKDFIGKLFKSVSNRLYPSSPYSNISIGLATEQDLAAMKALPHNKIKLRSDKELHKYLDSQRKNKEFISTLVTLSDGKKIILKRLFEQEDWNKMRDEAHQRWKVKNQINTLRNGFSKAYLKHNTEIK